jgi:hypothetical protein
MNVEPNELVEMPDNRTTAPLIRAAQSIHPDPRFVSSLEARLRQKHSSKVIRFPRRWIAAAAAIALLLMGAFWLSTPAGRATAQELLKYFKRDADNTTTVTVYGDGVGPHPDSNVDPRNIITAEQESNVLITLPDNLVAATSYTLYVPTWLPNNYVYEGVTDYTVDMTPPSTWMWFPCADETEPWQVVVIQYRTTLTQAMNMLRMEIGSDAQVEQVTIWGDVTAEYVKGTWDFSEPLTGEEVAPGEEMTMEQVWKSDIDYHTLSWYAQGNYFIVRSGGFNAIPGTNATSACPITREDFIAIANSLVPYEGNP